MTADTGRKVCLKRWKVSNIIHVVDLGTSTLAIVNTIEETDPWK